ncbi:MAG: molybdopterin-dependent oxidoreductase [Sutterellaceae bacterium]|nr:molybdopterin-dependent oxidoreductase [Sutterellaceae bacterium]
MSTPLNHTFITATHWGIVRGRTENGRIVEIAPHEADLWPSPNVGNLIERVYSKKRLLFPLVRSGYLKNGPASRAERGHDTFVRVSWEKALGLVADEIRRVYTEYGPQSVFGRSYGWKSAGCVNSSVSLLRRLLNLCGGYIPCANSYSTAAISAILPYVVGASDPAVPSWEAVLKNAGCVVFWGADPLVTNDIDWCTTIHEGKDYLRKLKASGIESLSINPVKTETAKFLGSRWIAPKQGSDTALMLALIVTLIDKGLADTEFLEHCTKGSDKFLAYAMGKTDGVKKDAQWAAPITGLSVEEIEKLALHLKENRTLLMMGWGPQRSRFGEQAPSMAYALACVLGHIGHAGGGIGTHYHYCDGGVPVYRGVSVPEISSVVAPQWFHAATGNRLADTIPVAKFADCFLNPGKTIDYAGKKVTYPDVKLVIWAGGNPFAHQPDTGKVVKAFQKPETIVVVESVMNATAEHADIILPACTSFERNDITGIGTYTQAGVCAMQQAITPLGESRSDWAIFSDLAERLDLLHAFSGGLTENERIRATYASVCDAAAGRGIAMPEFESFWETGTHFFDKDASRTFDDPWIAYREDPEGHRLATPSGKIELYSETLAAMGYSDVPPHPAYLCDRQTSETDEARYPLVLMSIKATERLHSQLDDTIDKPNGHFEPCRISAKDAQIRGIGNGQTIRVFNAQGSVLAKAVVSEDVAPGTVAMGHGAWYEPTLIDDMEVDAGGNTNTLTPDIETSRLSGGNVASGAKVEIETFADK